MITNGNENKIKKYREAPREMKTRREKEKKWKEIEERFWNNQGRSFYNKVKNMENGFQTQAYQNENRRYREMKLR